MIPTARARALTCLSLALGCDAVRLVAPRAGGADAAAAGHLPGLPSEMPAKFEPATDGFDYVRRDVMIPMRDGVKLHTVILVPKGAKGAPILLTRTPYDATGLTSHADSAPPRPDPAAATTTPPT